MENNTVSDRNPMPLQPPEKRICNFEEVALGYTKEMALNEAGRCLSCKNMPCVSGCPVNIKIPDFITKIKESDFEGAYKIISLNSSLPAVCGRVCPQETQCESKCIRGVKSKPVAIGRLERFVADYHNTLPQDESFSVQLTGAKIAVVGSGPAGLTCAGDLAKKGYRVTVFEALHAVGGVLTYGIPEFRLPKAIVKRETDNLRSLGVTFETDTVIGKTLTVEDLFSDGFEAVFIGSGAGLPKFMDIKGENLNGVYSANEFLTRINLMKAYRNDSATPVYSGKKTVVVGGGNVAMDAARCAKRMGSDVTVVYRRSEAELPARREEVEHAKEEGIHFCLLTNPVEICGKDGYADSVSCKKMELGEPDASGRRRPIEKAGSEFLIEADCVIMALGTSPNPLIKNTTDGLLVNQRGGIVADDTAMTSVAGVFAGGDAVTGSATVISAMGAGKLAATSIDNYIHSKKDV